ncbi:MAG TPA: glutamate--tRNA ligase [Ktedonobacteraceae bacterium]|nr:glutamate--tRNA ligase [Ktedonobacteraceae bacterium]
MTDLLNTSSSKDTPARTRYAPSPTGYPHIGNLRTAIYSYLVARQSGGQFILRIEDTDRRRYVEGSLAAIKDSLEWLGLDYDEGPDIGGPYAPYTQSERLDTYKKYAEQLVERGKAYYCYCSQERLEAVNKAKEAQKLPTGYDRHCRYLTEEERAQKTAEGIKPVIRFAVPLEGTTTFTDALRGQITIDNATLNDRILLKSDGMPTYELGHMVDDYLMNITHVIRGQEYIPSMPFYVLLYQALDFPMPVVIHVPLILNPPGKVGKLSKRDNAVSVVEYRENGYIAEALVNYLALMGWSYDDHTEIFSMEDLIEKFNIYHVHVASAKFSPEKLEWMNAYNINHILTEDDFARRSIPFLVSSGLISQEYAQDESHFEYIKAACALAKEKAKTLLDVAPEIEFAFVQAESLDYPLADLLRRNDGPATVANILEAIAQVMRDIPEAAFTHDGLYAAFAAVAESMGLKVGQVLWPPRIALTGKTKGPDIIAAMMLLGREETIRRLELAKQKLI